MPTPENYAAQRQAERAAKYATEVARLRALANASATEDPTEGADA